jgi:hypothetical protein
MMDSSEIVTRLKAKLCIPFLALTLVGWGLFLWQQAQPASAPIIRTVNRTQFVDRIVEKVVTQKVTKPDGTIIESVEQTNTKTIKSETVQSVPTPIVKPKASIGFEAQLPTTFDIRPPKQYEFQVGRRIGNSNAWWTTSLTTSDSLKPKAVSVGLRLEF